MNQPSRRQFLAVTGASAVAVGAAAVVPTLAGAAERPVGLDEDFSTDSAADEGPMIASVDDLGAGRISVMHGDTEFTVTDHDLAQRIARLVRSEA